MVRHVDLAGISWNKMGFMATNEPSMKTPLYVVGSGFTKGFSWPITDLKTTSSA